MSNTSISAIAVAAVLAIAAPAALVQPALAATPQAADQNRTGGTMANEVKPGEMLASKLNGATLYDEQGRDVGKVSDIVLDPNGRVVAVAVEPNSNITKGRNGATNGARSGENTVAIGMNDVKATTVNGEPRFMVTQTDQQLASAKPIELNPRNDNGPRNTNANAAAQNGQQPEARTNGQILASKLNGSDVNDRQNEKIGSIKDIVLDPNGRVAEVVLSTNGRNVAVPMQELHVAMDNDNTIKQVTIDKNKSDLQSAEVFNLNPKNRNGG